MAKYNNLTAVLLFIIGSIFLIETAKAVEEGVPGKMDDKKNQIEDKKTEALCSRIDNVVGRLEKYLDNDRIGLEERNRERVEEMKNTRASRDSELAERRETRNQSRNEFYEKLEKEAGDDSAKIATVKKFKERVELAIKTRREAIDQARENMNKGIDQAIQNRESEMKRMRSEFGAEIEKNISEVKNSCSNGVTSDELKDLLASFREDVKNSRNNYKNRIKEAKKVQSEIQKLREERKVAVKLAIENFKSSMKAAQEELRSAMGSQSNEE